MNPELLQILEQVLSDPQSGIRVGRRDGQWVMACGEGDSYEELVTAESWEDFIFKMGYYCGTESIRGRLE